MKLISWGANQYSQLAHVGWMTCEQCETFQTCDTTGLPEGIIDTITQICGGAGHTLLLDSEGRAWVCGLNNKGQCGQKPQSATAPGSLLLLWHQLETGGSRIVRVAAGWEHTLALTDTGVLLAWGSNSHGQLGTTVQQGEWSPLPVEVAHGVSSMSAGLRQSSWVTLDGRLKTCGSLGNKEHELPEFLHCQQVACGQRHLLTLVSAEDGEQEGQVWGLGDNKHGQLGVDSSSVSSVPQLTPVQQLLDLRFTQLSSGWSHAAAITRQGQVVCWGRRSYGQLGVSPSDPRATQPVAWPSIFNVQGHTDKAVQLALGSEHTLVRLESGTVVSCGWNEHGNCGTGDLKDLHSPRVILTNAKLIGCGSAHCFAVVSDS